MSLIYEGTCSSVSVSTLVSLRGATNVVSAGTLLLGERIERATESIRDFSIALRDYIPPEPPPTPRKPFDRYSAPRGSQVVDRRIALAPRARSNC